MVSEGGVPRGRVVPARGLHRDQTWRRRAGRWCASTTSGERRSEMTRLSCHRFRSNQVRLALSLLALQSGQFVAAVGAAQANRQLVADQLGATAGEDRWAAGETCTLLLAASSTSAPGPNCSVRLGSTRSSGADHRGCGRFPPVTNTYAPYRLCSAGSAAETFWPDLVTRRAWLQEGWSTLH